MALPLCDATFAVIDVETTGIDPSVDRVVEVACAVVRDGKETDAFSSLINPGRSIPRLRPRFIILRTATCKMRRRSAT
jgi:DNA polymerase-3 subunit epsilon